MERNEKCIFFNEMESIIWLALMVKEIVEIDCFFLEKIFLCLIFIIFLVIAFNYYFIKK